MLPWTKLNLIEEQKQGLVIALKRLIYKMYLQVKNKIYYWS
jgi:hypothetical protein